MEQKVRGTRSLEKSREHRRSIVSIVVDGVEQGFDANNARLSIGKAGILLGLKKSTVHWS